MNKDKYQDKDFGSPKKNNKNLKSNLNNNSKKYNPNFALLKLNELIMDDEPINWYFTDINNFCNEDEIGEEKWLLKLF